MPRVSAAHEQEVRDRILAAAARVFSEKGYHSATIADVVRESGLSVGAIYTLLHGQGRAHPADLRPDRRARARRARRAARRRPRPPPSGWPSRSASTSRPSTSTTVRPGQVTLVQAWAEADREPGVREMLAGRRERLVGAGQLLLRQGVASGELPAWLDVDAVTRGVPRPARRPDAPAHRGRRRLPPGRPRAARRRPSSSCCSRAGAIAGRPALGARRDGVASRAMAHVQTVLGPIEPDALGFTLPHEHTQIALWHIEARWDYWQLTRDEPVILDELARFRAAGGSGLVDLTLPGVGRDPAWLRGLAEASGLHIVMGCGWYRTAYYPPEARIDRRSVDDLADELVREVDRRGGGVGRPARDHRRDRDRQAVGLAGRGARPSGGRPRVAPDRAGDHDPRRDVRRRPRPAPDLRGGGRRSRRGSSSATPTRTRSSTTTWRSSSAARTSSSTSSGCRGTRTSVGERRASSSCCASCWARATPIACSSARTSATTRSSRRYGGNGYTYLADTFLPRLRAAGVSDDEIETMTVANPRRLLTIG